MENDFDNRTKDDYSVKVSRRKPWSALIIWPALVITIFIFIFSMVPFERDESDKINIHETIINIVKIFNPNIRTAEISVMPKDNTTIIKSAIDTYLLNTGQYPDTLNDLIVDPKLNGWTGPYLYPKLLNDPFGNPLIYIPNINGNYKLISYGDDGLPDGEDNNADVIYDY